MMSSSEAVHHSASFFLFYFARKFDLRLSTLLLLIFLACLDRPRGKVIQYSLNTNSTAGIENNGRQILPANELCCC